MTIARTICNNYVQNTVWNVEVLLDNVVTNVRWGENLYNSLKTKARFSRLLRHQAWKRSGSILIDWEGTEKQENGW